MSEYQDFMKACIVSFFMVTAMGILTSVAYCIVKLIATIGDELSIELSRWFRERRKEDRHD